MPNNLYNQYIYKNGSWYKIGTSSESVTYSITYVGNTLTLTGSDGSVSTATIASGGDLKSISVNGTAITIDSQGNADITVPTKVSDLTNDAGYTTNTGTVTSVRVQATSPVQSSTSTVQSSTLDTTISLADGYGDTKNPYGTKNANYVLAGPTSGSATTPTFRALVANDIPDLSGTYAPKATTLSGYGITDAKIQNGTITLGSNTITPLTSFTETDPTVPSWAKQSTKPSYNFSEIGSTPNSLSGYGITDAYTKTEVDGLVSGVLHYKGTKATTSALPSSGNVIGDVWHITADGSEWAWDGTTWQELGTAVDLSGYVPTSRTINGKALTGNITLSASDVGAMSSSFTESDPIFTASAAYGISSTDITNWNSKTSNTGTVTSVRVQATSPVQSSTSTAQSTSLNTTISLADGYGDTKNPYGTKTKNYVLAGPTTGSNAVPSFRALVAGDIPDLSGTYAPKATTLSGYGITDAKIENGTITLGSNTITPLTSHQDISGKVSKTGDTMTGYLNFTNWMGIKFTSDDYSVILTATGFTSTQAKVGFNKLTLLQNIATPSGNTDAANKQYVDDAISGIDLSDYIASDEVGKVYVSDTEPSNTSNYDIWIDTSSNLINANGVMV